MEATSEHSIIYLITTQRQTRNIAGYIDPNYMTFSQNAYSLLIGRLRSESYEF